VTNCGGGVLQGIATVGPNDFGFRISNNASYTLSAGQQQDVTVKFAPLGSQLGDRLVTYRGTVAVSSNTVTLTGSSRCETPLGIIR